MSDKANKVYDHRDITQRYCPHIDDNVVVVRDLDRRPDEYECLSSHLCMNSVSKSAESCKRRRNQANR